VRHQGAEDEEDAMKALIAAAALAILAAPAAFAQNGNTAGTSSNKAPQAQGMSGIDISQAGTTPQSQKAWFKARTRDEQAQIMQDCNDMTAVNSKMTQQDTTGSVAAATTTNSAANVDSNMSSTGMSNQQMQTFCRAIK
jgi:opacity protein-like surface antigen